MNTYGGGPNALPVPESDFTCTVFQASEELEDRESLAVMAASAAGLGGEDEEGGGGANGSGGSGAAESGDGETFIEKYTRGVSAVETILKLDRLRQSVAVKEMLTEKANSQLPTAQPASDSSAASSLRMRKTVSVPNFSQAVMSSSFSLDNLAGLSSGGAGSSLMRVSESFNDLKAEQGPPPSSRRSLPSSTRAEPDDNKPPFGLGTYSLRRRLILLLL